MGKVILFLRNLKVALMSIMLNASSVMISQPISNSAKSRITGSVSKAATQYPTSKVFCQMSWVLIGPLEMKPTHYGNASTL
jgi:hypothetical protein